MQLREQIEALVTEDKREFSERDRAAFDADQQRVGDGRTRATYSLEVDLGRMLGMVIRGPLVDLLRGNLVNARAGELKRTIELGS